MLRIENLSKSYGTQVLFAGVTVNINRGERVGLVGRNGHGKTTLLRLMTGEETPDSGSIVAPKGYRVGYLKQQLDFTVPTVLDEAALGLPDEEKDQVWRAEKVLAGLGFSPEEMSRPPETFSGGFQVRLNLAKLLVSDSDLLLLDEPTNYLDIVAIRWLERFFRSWRGELLMVTHDRSFMDSVTTHTMGIHRRRIRKMPGDTARYYGQIALEEEVHEKSRINIERKRKQTEEFIRKFRAKARLVGLVQSRIRTLEKQKVPDRLEAIRSLDLIFRSAPTEAKVILQCRDLGYRWAPELPDLFNDLDLTVAKGDRIAVVGPNGKGKSTFLRVLAGELEAGTGTVGVHGTTRVGFYGQTNVERLEPNRTVVEELVAGEPDGSVQKARGVAGTMMFEGDAALKKISVLSGGEKSRVLLGRLLLEPHNLLLLDEPTNHLDMDSCEALLNALEEFEGAVIIVTHNEMFLHNLAQRLVVFDRGRSSIFEGTYQNFLDEVGWESEEDEGKADTETRGHGDAEKEQKKESKKGTRKERARLLQEKSKELSPFREKAQKLEKVIEEMETKIEQVNEKLIDASTSGDGEVIGALSKELSDLKTDLEDRYEELFKTTEELEQLEEKWEEQP